MKSIITPRERGAGLVLFLVILLCTNSLSGQVPEGRQREFHWYDNSIIYTLDVDTFKDSDGDGVGDFKGLVQKLDYLEALGVDALWLSPFQPTPNRDDGYDISDYYAIDPRLGTSSDFTEFLLQAKQRGMRIIMDLVLNHTSDQHPWFKQARRDPSSKYRSYYVWSKTKPADWNKGMVFPGVQKETWSLDSVAHEYYYHRFYDFQPDLDYNNVEVRKESERIISYWLNQGVDGFRLDAVPFIIEVTGTGTDKPDHRFTLINTLRQKVQWTKGDAILLGEANVLPEENKDYFGEQGERMQMMFNFYANQHLFYALASGDIKTFVQAMQDSKETFATSQWAFFLRNHDEVDLGRLTNKQRQKVYDAFGPEKNMQLYERGIRRRLAPMLNNEAQLKMVNSLLLSFPGTPVIRYGDEIGMGDDLQQQERLSVRSPMQWTSEDNAGFTASKTPIRPLVSSGRYDYHQVNVATQRTSASSLLNWTAQMIRLRKECPEIGLGSYEILPGASTSVLIIKYTYEGKSVITLHNFSAQSEGVKFSAAGTRLFNLLDGNSLSANQEKEFSTLVSGYGYVWYRVDSPVR